MKAIAQTGSPEKTTVELDLFSDRDIPAAARDQIREDVGDYLLEQVLVSLQSAKTPVAGESWPALSKEYRARKLEEGGSGKPDMELMGDMLDELSWKATDDGIEVGFWGDQADKADGHLKFSGRENNTPQRRFLPGEGQAFKRGVQSEVERIVADAILENAEIDPADLEDVETRSALYEVLSEALGGSLSNAEIRAAVSRTPSIVKVLKDADLLDLL